MAQPITIRTLTADDAANYQACRLRALKDHPEAFGASYEQSLDTPLEEVAARITPQPDKVLLGAFMDGALVGTVGAYCESHQKMAHRAHVFAMYVAPEVRGNGVGRQLVQAIIATVRGWDGVKDLHLAVTLGNTAARTIYRDAGFITWGVDPRALRVGDRYHDLEWMVLKLD